MALALHECALADTPDRWWPAATDAALQAAGGNRSELEKALTGVPANQRESMQFLIENMPPGDLKTMKADFLIAHVAQAHQDIANAPWGKSVPREVFLNDVLPYASLNEPRDEGRAKLRPIAAPLVKDCKSPGEAAQVLNQKLFGIVKVRYSTERKKPDQSALESMESGVATCSGLSILLVDACRSVGVPARVVGTPMWTNLRGNHTWVEVWDGDWHFAGAAEPDRKGLDHGWFVGDAAKADDSKPEHRIYASSFKKTGLTFPLVWDLDLDWVPAVNVTARYTGAAKIAEGKVRLLVRVLDRAGGKRVAAKVTVTDASDATQILNGTSRDEAADLNNLLPFQVAPKRTYKIEASLDGKSASAELTTTDQAEQVTTLTLGS
jgi:hypothetical protein